MIPTLFSVDNERRVTTMVVFLFYLINPVVLWYCPIVVSETDDKF